MTVPKNPSGLLSDRARERAAEFGLGRDHDLLIELANALDQAAAILISAFTPAEEDTDNDERD